MSVGIFKESVHSKLGLDVLRCVLDFRIALKIPAPIVFVVVLHSLYLLASPRALFEDARDHCVWTCVVFRFPAYLSQGW